MSTSQDILLRDVEAFLTTTGMAASVFGERIMNDRHLVRKLRNGREVKITTADRIRAFITEHRSEKPKRRPFGPASHVA